MARALGEYARCQRAAAVAFGVGDRRSARGFQADARAALDRFPTLLDALERVG